MTADDNAAVKSPGGAGGSTPPLSELKWLGKYQIDKKIGAGGMGTVFLARDTELKRTVAIKVLPKDKAENPILVRRFRAEAQAAAQLRHPNIVAVYDSGEADGYLYIAMEYVEGRDLFEMVSIRGVVPVRRSIDIIKQVAAALQHAYEQNIVHRDIKPSNLLIRRDGVVKLTDLGLARSIDDTLETNITRAGTTVGTVDYMAPEQARNSKLADIRSDLYSLGCTWYQMLTGSPPYPEGSVTNKLQAHALKPIPDPREKNPQVPEGLTAVIRRMMAKKPDDRYQTPAELIEELNHAKLTQASISREIFSDLSDDESGTDRIDFDDEEELSDDGYFELNDQRKKQETPDQATAVPGSPARKKSSRPATSDEPEDTTPDPDKPKSRAPKQNRQDPESETAGKSSRTGRPRSPVPSEEEDTPDPVTRKLKPRPGQPDQGETVGNSTAKAVDSKSASKPARTPGQKTLPPKRQPVSNQVDSPPSVVSKDLLKYIGAIAGIVCVIVGIGWLISSFSHNVGVDKNPFGPAEVTTETPAVATIPGNAAAATKPSDVSAETTTVAAATTTATGTRPEIGTAFDVEKIPEWAARGVDFSGLPSLTVSPAARSATNFNSLAEALQATSPDGAVIKLQGAGPFPLPLVELEQRKRIVVTSGSPQERPVIVLKPAEGQTTAGLKLKDGTLELRGLHFSIDRQVVAGSVKAVEVSDGQLIVQECSFTASGISTEPALALVVHSALDSTSVPRLDPTVLIDRVLVRGEGLGGLGIRRANADVVIRDSLMATGSAPAIEIAGHIVPAAADVATTKPRRILRIQRSTLSGQNRIFDVAVDETGKPPQTAVVLRDSICSALGVVPNSAIVSAGRWPQTRTTAESWLTKMTWTSTNTLYLGFEQLIDLGSSFKVADAATWQRVWNVRTDARQFQKLAFPETTIDDLSVTLPQEFDSSGLSFRDVKSTDGGLPGCPVTKLSTPDVTSQLRALAVTSRPPLPAAAAKPAEPVQIRKIDLKKEDLGAVLNRADWPSGTLFEASGGGLCQMSPAKIDGKSLRIVFRQTEGASLKLQPLQPKSADAARTDIAALISITHGSLELTNATLEGSPNPRGITPEWMIHATDSTVILNGCRLIGSEVDNPRQVGLLRWTTAAPTAPGTEPPALVVRDCYLAGTGCGIRAECGQGPMILRNSVLAVRGDALDLRPARTADALLPVLDAESLTFSATNAALRIEAAPGAEPITIPMRLFVERCAFAPPLTFKAGEATSATLMQLVGPVIEQHQIEYWGTSNGVARQVVHLVRRDGDTGAADDERTGVAAWRKLWDKGRSLRLLAGDKGIYLAGELPVRWKELKPGSFELHKNSLATTWAEGGRPIGANTRAVEDSSLAKKSGEAPAKNQPTIVNPTKKNVGF